MTNSVKCPLKLALFPLLLAYQGFALSQTWGWFVVAKFGAPPLGVAEAVGLSAIVALVVPTSGGPAPEWWLPPAKITLVLVVALCIKPFL